MFEQTFIDSARMETGHATRKPWPMAASFAGQTAFVAAILAVPLFQTAKLAWTPPVPMVFMPPKPVVIPVSQAPAAASQAAVIRPMFRPVFSAPTRIPSRIVTTPDPDPGSLLPQLASASPSVNPLAGFAVASTIPKASPAAPPAVREPAKPSSLKVSAGVQAAKLLRQIKPVYPPLARAARMSGTVRLQAIIGADGRIRNLQLVSGPPLLVQAALEAVKQWQYEPTLLNGVPVEVITSIEVNFTLSQ